MAIELGEAIRVISDELNANRRFLAATPLEKFRAQLSIIKVVLKPNHGKTSPGATNDNIALLGKEFNPPINLDSVSLVFALGSLAVTQEGYIIAEELEDEIKEKLFPLPPAEEHLQSSQFQKPGAQAWNKLAKNHQTEFVEDWKKRGNGPDEDGDWDAKNRDPIWPVE
jgi:hypothetical protein